MKTLKKSITIVILAIFSFTGVFAQSDNNEISKEELQMYANIKSEMQEVKQEIQLNSAKIILEQNLDLKRYYLIDLQEEKSDIQIEASEQEMEKYERVKEEIKELNERLKETEKKLLEGREMSVKRYREIKNAIKNNPELQNQLNDMGYQ